MDKLLFLQISEFFLICLWHSFLICFWKINSYEREKVCFAGNGHIAHCCTGPGKM